MSAAIAYEYPEEHYTLNARLQLQGRGFTEVQVEWWMNSAKVRYERHEEIAARFGPKADGLILPYFDLDGSPVIDANGRPFERVRFGSGLNGAQLKHRYSQEPGTQLHAYLPPLVGETWREVLADPTREIALTEGEFKAGQATFAGIPTVGLGGIDCFVTRNGGIVPELRGTTWRGRTVFIVFDAPMHKKLRQSVRRTASYLAAKGAFIRICDIGATATYKECQEQAAAWRAKLEDRPVDVESLDSPPAFLMGKDGKMGLDDFLLAGGSYPKLRADAKSISEAFEDFDGTEDEADNPLLTEIAIVTGYPGVFFLHLTGPEAGITRTRESMAMVQAPSKIIKADGQTTKMVPAFTNWLENPWRTTVGIIVTKPALPPLSITPDGNWNSWPGLVTVPKKNAAHAELFYSFVRDFFYSEVEGPEVSELHRKRFLQWAGHLFQKMGQRHVSSWTFTSDQEGIGKSALGELLADIIGTKGRDSHGGGAGAAVVGANTFEDGYVDIWPGKMLIVANEPSSDNAKMRQFMKNARTNPFLSSNTKYGAKFDIANELAFIFTTNEPYAFGISESARRDWVWEPDKKQSDKEWARRASEFANLAKGPDREGSDFRAAVLWELLYEVDLSDYDPYAYAAGSKAKTAAAAASLSRVDSGTKDILGDILDLFNDPSVKAVAWTQEAWIRFSGEPNRNVQTTTKAHLKRQLEKLGYEVERPQLGPKNARFKVWSVCRRGVNWVQLTPEEKVQAAEMGLNCGMSGTSADVG